MPYLTSLNASSFVTFPWIKRIHECATRAGNCRNLYYTPFSLRLEWTVMTVMMLRSWHRLYFVVVVVATLLALKDLTPCLIFICLNRHSVVNFQIKINPAELLVRSSVSFHPWLSEWLIVREILSVYICIKKLTCLP